MIGKLRRQQRIHGNLCTCARNLDASLTAFYEEHTHLIAGDSKINLIPFPLAEALP